MNEEEQKISTLIDDYNYDRVSLLASRRFSASDECVILFAFVLDHSMYLGYAYNNNNNTERS